MQKNFARQGRKRPAPQPTVCARQANADQASRRILDAIYRRERDELLRYLKRQVGQELASDIAQDVFLRASASRQLPELVNPGGYLHRIARNILIDRARRAKCSIRTLPLLGDGDAACAAEQEQELEADDMRMSFADALAFLPERTRTIFTMHRFEEMAYREIQRELDISMAAVEYHMMKAIRHLRRAMETIG